MSSPQPISIFISSPGDVAAERQIAGKVIGELQGKYWSFVRLDDVFWEKRVVRSTAHYQDELVNPANCDIVIGILWMRLGSRLPEQFLKEDGSRYESGTEWELEMAHEGYVKNLLECGDPFSAKPDIITYRRNQPRAIQEDPANEIEAAEQERKLEGYLQEHHKFADGTIRRPVIPYKDLDAFGAKLRDNLEELILRHIPKLTKGYEPPPISGSPFVGLRAFHFEDADRYFGRNREIREIQRLLTASAERGLPFVLIYGGSGYGKSSLMRAGLAPVITRPGGALPGIVGWRRVSFQAAASSGPLCERLARALISPPSKEDSAFTRAYEHWPLTGMPDPAAAGAEWDIPELARALEDDGTRPAAIAALAQSLEYANRHLLLEIDQLEEIFTLKGKGMEEAQTTAFFQTLTALCQSGRVWVAATMRSEFFPHIARQPELFALVGMDRGYILPPPDRQSLREMIVYPAMAARLEYAKWFDPVEAAGDKAVKESIRHAEDLKRRAEAIRTGVDSLEEQILSDAEDSPDSLPLLEFTLQTLFEGKDGKFLTWEAYIDAGGLKGAIARRAAAIYQKLENSQREARHRIFAALLNVDPANGATTRQRAPLAALTGTPEEKAFTDAFISERLFVTDHDAATGTAEVTLAHEALITHWTELSTWLERHRSRLQARRRLRDAAELWSTYGRSRSHLLSEARLAEAEDTAFSGLFTLTPSETDFLRLSRDHARRKQRQLKGAVVIFALLAAGAGIAGWMAKKNGDEAIIRKEQAERQTKRAEEQTKLATANEELATANEQKANRSLADAYYRQAVELLERGDEENLIHRKAAAMLGAALKADPGNANARMRMISLLKDSPWPMPTLSFPVEDPDGVVQIIRPGRSEAHLSSTPARDGKEISPADDPMRFIYLIRDERVDKLDTTSGKITSIPLPDVPQQKGENEWFHTRVEIPDGGGRILVHKQGRSYQNGTDQQHGMYALLNEEGTPLFLAKFPNAYPPEITISGDGTAFFVYDESSGLLARHSMQNGKKLKEEKLTTKSPGFSWISSEHSMERSIRSCGKNHLLLRLRANETSKRILIVDQEDLKPTGTFRGNGAEHAFSIDPDSPYLYLWDIQYEKPTTVHRLTREGNLVGSCSFLIPPQLTSGVDSSFQLEEAPGGGGVVMAGYSSPTLVSIPWPASEKKLHIPQEDIRFTSHINTANAGISALIPCGGGHALMTTSGDFVVQVHGHPAPMGWEEIPEASMERIWIPLQANRAWKSHDGHTLLLLNDSTLNIHTWRVPRLSPSSETAAGDPTPPAPNPTSAAADFLHHAGEFRIHMPGIDREVDLATFKVPDESISRTWKTGDGTQLISKTQPPDENGEDSDIERYTVTQLHPSKDGTMALFSIILPGEENSTAACLIHLPSRTVHPVPLPRNDPEDGKDAGIRAVFSDDGSKLAIAFGESTTQLYTTHPLQPLGDRIPGEESYFSPDSLHLAVFRHDLRDNVSFARFYDTDTALPVSEPLPLWQAYPRMPDPVRAGGIIAHHESGASIRRLLIRWPSLMAFGNATSKDLDDLGQYISQYEINSRNATIPIPREKLQLLERDLSERKLLPPALPDTVLMLREFRNDQDGGFPIEIPREAIKAETLAEQNDISIEQLRSWNPRLPYSDGTKPLADNTYIPEGTEVWIKEPPSGDSNDNSPAPAEGGQSSPETKPSVRSYTIEHEATFGEIARQLGITVELINELNGLDLPENRLIAKGSELWIPATAEKTAPDTTQNDDLPWIQEAVPGADGTFLLKIQRELTFLEIAEKLGTTIGRLNEINDLTLSPKTKLSRGSELFWKTDSRDKPAETPQEKTPEQEPKKQETSRTEGPSSPAGLKSVIITEEITYRDLAARYGTSIQWLNQANGLELSEGTKLAKGSEFYIPNDKTAERPLQKVSTPDEEIAQPPAAPPAGLKTVIVDEIITYEEFARKYHTSLEQLNSDNGLDLKTNTLLARGSELYVPEAPVGAAGQTGGDITASPSTPLRRVIIPEMITMEKFARQHGTTVEKINEMNGTNLSPVTILAKHSEMYVPEEESIMEAAKPAEGAKATN